MAELGKKVAQKKQEDPENLGQLYSHKWKQHPIKPNPEFGEEVKEKFTIIPNEVLFGIEFEIENARHLPDHWPNYFVFDEDGSLRDGGRELKYCGKGVGLARALTEYHNHLPAQVSFSPRTSIHVHVDCRNLTGDRMLQFLVLSILYEKAFYMFCGMSREASAFCVPIYKTPICADIRHTMHQVGFENKSYSKLHAVDYLRNMWSKYLGTNLAPISSFGTLEFRQMQGHRNMAHLVDWLNILGNLKISTAKNTFEDLLVEVRELNTNSAYEAFTRNILGKAAGPLLDIKGFSKHMEDGVISVKHAFSPIKDILKFMKSVKEDSSYYKTFPEDAIGFGKERNPIDVEEDMDEPPPPPEDDEEDFHREQEQLHEDEIEAALRNPEVIAGAIEREVAWNLQQQIMLERENRGLQDQIELDNQRLAINIAGGNDPERVLERLGIQDRIRSNQQTIQNNDEAKRSFQTKVGMLRRGNVMPRRDFLLAERDHLRRNEALAAQAMQQHWNQPNPPVQPEQVRPGGVRRARINPEALNHWFVAGNNNGNVAVDIEAADPNPQQGAPF